jgi:hypothetical protein
MGAMKAIKATVTGLTGVFKKLSEEHGEVTALLLRVKTSSDPAVRRELFPTIRAELLAHERGEIRAVYPAFRVRPELKAIADEHDAEAGILEQALDQLSATDYADASWKGKFDKVVELVSQHTKKEENDYFRKASRILGKEESQKLQPAFEASRADAMRELKS